MTWFSVKKLCGMIVALGLFCSASARMNAQTINAVDIKPSPQQVTWQDLEYGVIIHFGTNTFLNREWGDGTADPKVFNPANADPDQWIRAAKESGARYVVLVAKHHDGFCLWPTAVANPNRAGWHTERDVVGELAEAVRAEGLRFGLYYSGGLDWTFNPAPVGSTAAVAASMPRGAYPAYAEAQVREL